MTISELFFYFFSIGAVLSAVMILVTRNVIHAGFFLLAALLSVSGIFVLAFADFLAVAQIMIYVGGVLLLMLFGVMLTNRIAGERFLVTEMNNRLSGSILTLVLLGFLMSRINEFSELVYSKETQPSSTVQKIGLNLMTDYILPFEAAAFILLVALLGAAFIAGKVVKQKK